MTGLVDAFSKNLMGITAENIAKKFNITREMQDEYAVNSHQKASISQTASYFKMKYYQYRSRLKKELKTFEQDEGIRTNASLEALSKLLPAFAKEGSVTAGNASSINDGATCLMIASEEALKIYNIKPLARIISYASVGVDPNIMGTGPGPASNKALEKAGWKAEELHVIEANEAFAAQAIYVNQAMQWDVNKVNMNGGAMAIGHPIGASEARILVTLIHQMKRVDAKKV